MIDVTHNHLTHPIVVSYGAGVDSTAMLVAMWKRGIVPDAILFADTNAEKPETYDYLITMNAWLISVGFPRITVVRYTPPIAPYKDLEGNCLANETIPSLAFRSNHSCSIKWKQVPQDKWLKTWVPAQIAWKLGGRVVKCIGYDNGRQDSKRRAKADKTQAKFADDRVEFCYPLQDWEIDREKCADVIRSVGLPVPVKSSCFFCPAMKKDEITELAIKHPDLALRALRMEQRFLTGKHARPDSTIKGLGMGKFAWSQHLGHTVITINHNR